MLDKACSAVDPSPFTERLSFDWERSVRDEEDSVALFYSEVLDSDLTGRGQSGMKRTQSHFSTVGF